MHLVRAKPPASERANRNRSFTALKRALNLHPKVAEVSISVCWLGGLHYLAKGMAGLIDRSDKMW
jgi:hypothetical protein